MKFASETRNYGKQVPSTRTINHFIAPVLKSRRFRVISLLVMLFYMIGKIVHSVENCTTLKTLRVANSQSG